jgi:hypothetical protein
LEALNVLLGQRRLLVRNRAAVTPTPPKEIAQGHCPES